MLARILATIGLKLAGGWSIENKIVIGAWLTISGPTWHGQWARAARTKDSELLRWWLFHTPNTQQPAYIDQLSQVMRIVVGDKQRLA